MIEELKRIIKKREKKENSIYNRYKKAFMDLKQKYE